MIERYTRPVLADLWSDARRYQTWLAVELAACEAMEQTGRVPRGTAAAVRQRAEGKLDPKTILDIETRTRHDVIAFLTHVEELAGEPARWLHLGMTSSDVLDASLAILLRDAADEILAGIDLLTTALATLGLTPETVPTQVVSRDRHAGYFTALARLGTAVERLALTVRHWQRTEVGEAMEAFGKGQKGSSAMPHKKNPILSENLCDLARMLRHYAGAAMENVALWHERDISHSSVERVIAPDATGLADFMVRRAASLVEGLVVNTARMRENLELTGGLFFSKTVLLALIGKGMARQAAYELVQKHALAASANIGRRNVNVDPGTSFRELLAADPEVAGKLSAEELDRCFDLEHHLRFTGEIVDRALRAP